MKLEHIAEPRLKFANGDHVCPRRGIAAFGAFDRSMGTRRTDVILGGVGSATCNEALSRWVAKCSTEIPGDPDANQPNLHIGFPGVNLGHGFDAVLKFSTDLARTIKKSEIDEIRPLVVPCGSKVRIAGGGALWASGQVAERLVHLSMGHV